MNKSTLRTYADLNDEVYRIADQIVNDRHVRRFKYTLVLYVTEVDMTPIDQNKVSIHYVEEGRSIETESFVIHVDIDDFCNPEHLIKFHDL